MLGLGLTQQFRKRRFRAERVEPGVVGQGWKTKEPTGDDAFEQTERWTDLVQMGEVPRQVEQSLGIPEVRRDDAAHR